MTHDRTREDSADGRRLGIWTVAKSVGAAFFGVQTEANRRRDFAHGRLHHFVLVGLVATAVFVVVLVVLVQTLLAWAGP